MTQKFFSPKRGYSRLLFTCIIVVAVSLMVVLPYALNRAQAIDGTVTTCNYTTFYNLFITLPRGGNITFNCNGTILLPTDTQHQIGLLEDTVLDATGHDVTFQGNGNRVFLVQPGASLTLKNIKVTGGTAGNGGGIMNEGTLILEGASHIFGNAAVLDGPGTGYGGGIWNSGTLIVRDGSIVGGTVAQGNTADTDGGGIFNLASGTVTIEGGAVVSGNTADANGGALMNNGTMTIKDNTTVIGGDNSVVGSEHTNTAVSGNGGGIFNDGALTIEGGAKVYGNAALWHGGGVFNASGTVTVKDTGTQIGSTYPNYNTAVWNGGGIFNNTGGTLVVEGSAAVAGNSAGESGGGIYNNAAATIQGNQTLIGSAAKNMAMNGGGIANVGTLTIQNGAIVNYNEAYPSGSGGAIYNTMEGTTTISGNGTLIGGALPNTAPDGAGIFNTAASTVIVQNGAQVTGNEATFNGGGIYNDGGSTVTVQALGTSISGNSADNGGGIYTSGAGSSVTVKTAAIVAGNTVANNGGGVYNNTGSMLTVQGKGTAIGGSAANTASFGAGIYNNTGATTSIQTGADVASNQAAYDGGGIYNLGQVVVNGGGTAVRDNTANYGAGVYNNTGATLDVQAGAAFSGNAAANEGGAVYNTGTTTVTGTGTTVGGTTPNTALAGGGIATSGAGSAVNVGGGAMISANTATTTGGGIFNNGSTVTILQSKVYSNGAATNGGGVFNQSGPLTVDRSTFAYNTATTNGAAIYNQGGLNVVNSTFSTNNASNRGGAIYNTSGSNTITNTTIYNNGSKANGDGGGLYNLGTTAFRNVLIASNTGGNCGGGSIPTNNGGSIQFGDNYCGPTVLVAPSQPLNASLAANGTHSLVDGSYAIDRAIAVDCPATDQIGSIRWDGDGFPDSPQVGDCDAGSYELLNFVADAPALVSPRNRATLGTNTVSLVWEGVSLAINYRVQIANDNLFGSVVHTATLSELSYVTPALPDGVYYWRVAGLNGLSVHGYWSESRSFIINTARPTPPRSLQPASGSILSDPTPLFRWQSVEGSTSYVFQLAADQDFTIVLMEETVLTRPLYRVPAEMPLLPGTYWWRVASVNGADVQSGWNEAWSFTIAVDMATEEPPTQVPTPTEQPTVDPLPTLIVPTPTQPPPPNKPAGSTPPPPPHSNDKVPPADDSSGRPPTSSTH